LTKGFGNRLLHEVQRLAVKDMRIKILAPPERIYTTWTGGSILAGLSTFKKVGAAFSSRCALVTDTCMQMWVEKDEWQENPDIIHTKFA
jgi:centractin